jgi:hypothetical protein
METPTSVSRSKVWRKGGKSKASNTPVRASIDPWHRGPPYALPVFRTLVISFNMIIGVELVQCPFQRAQAKEDHPVETLVPQGSHVAFKLDVGALLPEMDCEIEIGIGSRGNRLVLTPSDLRYG